MLEKPPTLQDNPEVKADEACVDKLFEVPDGGTRAWLCVFGGFMLSVTCYGVANTFGVFEEYYFANQLSNESLKNISWIGSLQLCLISLTGSVSGPLCDAGYFKHLIAFGGLLYVFCLMMTSISTQYYQFVLSQGLGVGIAQGMIFTPGMVVLAHHFKRYRSVAFGIFATGASIGGVILPIALQKLFAQVGFGWAVRIFGFMVFFCIATGFACCTTRFPPRKGGRVLDVRVFKSPSYSLLVLGSIFFSLGLYAPINFGAVYATEHGMSQDLAFYSVAILNTGSFFGRVLPNVLAPDFGPLNTLIIACTISSVSLYVWFTVTGNAGILAFSVIYGITSGAYVSCEPTAVASLTKNPNETGLRLGMLYLSTSFFWLVNSPIQGAIIGSGGYWPVCVFSGSMVMLGVASTVVSRYLVQRETRSWKI